MLRYPPKTAEKARTHTKPGKRLRVRTLEELRPLFRGGRYRLGPHVHRHAACEGFSEKDVVAAALYGQELLRYLEDERTLVLGYICPSFEVRIPLHVVLEYTRARWVDVVTAFIPTHAHSAVSRTRLAEMLRYDKLPNKRQHTRGVRWGGEPCACEADARET